MNEEIPTEERKPKELKSLAYICGTDIQHEMQEPQMWGDCRITPNERWAKEKFACADGCGIAEVEIRFVRWITEPKI